MYFDFEDQRPDTPTIPRPLSRLEVVLLTIVVHMTLLILILVWPELPWVKAFEAQRQQVQAQLRQQELERQRENARFVFVQPRVDVQAPKPPPRAELSDIDRQARTVERARNPTNNMPFARGNSSERIEAAPPVQPRGQQGTQQQVEPAQEPDQARQGLFLPESLSALEPRANETARQPPRETKDWTLSMSSARTSSTVWIVPWVCGHLDCRGCASCLDCWGQRGSCYFSSGRPLSVGRLTWVASPGIRSPRLFRPPSR